MPKNEECLITLARYGTASHLERTVAEYRRIERLNDPARILSGRYGRGLEWHWDEDGMLVVRSRLAPEDGALFIRAIEAMKDRMYRDDRQAACTEA